MKKSRLQNLIVELRVAALYDPEAEHILNLVGKIYETITELCANGKIVKLQTKTETHFIHEVENLDQFNLIYDTSYMVDLSLATCAEVYDGPA